MSRRQASGLRRSLKRGALALGLGTLAMAATATSAGATNSYHDPEGFALTEFLTATDDYTSGAHPDVNTTFRFRSLLEGSTLMPFGRVRRIEIDLPPGLVGNPTNFPQCPLDDFLRDTGCPAETQVGVGTLEAWGLELGDDVPINVLEHGPDEPALLGIKPGWDLYGYIRIETRPDGGLTAITDEIPIAHPIAGADLTLWGVPADHNGSGAPRRPFMTAPTQCRTIDPTVIRAYSYEGKFATASHSLDRGAERCGELAFKPTITAVPTARSTASPTGLSVQIKVPQDNWADGRTTAHVETVKVVLPEGMSVSPSSANGLAACLPAQFGYRTNSPITCPDASRIGDVSIKTPLLEEPMAGSVYLAAQNDNPFNSLLALYVSVEGAGITVKLAGRVDPDPVTGRLTTSFADNPQLPFEQFDLRFKSGTRAPLVTPQTCGEYHTDTVVTSWADHSVSASTPFTIDQNCVPVGFSPSFRAGTVSAAGGKSSTFSLTFGRGDHDAELRDVTVQMPEGLTGKLAETEPCADGAVAAGTCGDASRIGTVTTAAGPGTTPFHLPGRAYMTGPYNGAPLGIAFVVPAVAGPFNLGTVIVRSGVFVDRRTAALRVVSDPLPRILQGIPLYVRTVNVAIDKPGFMINPTSCSAKRLSARITSQRGNGADTGSRFQVGGCRSLPLRPKMVLSIGERGRTRANSTVPFTAKLTQTPGQSNLKQVAVNLPFSLASRLEAVATSAGCTPEVFDAERCSIAVGSATAVSPLLRDPLRGNVYLVRNPARRLPDLMVRLRAQSWTSGIVIDLTGHVRIERDLSIRTTFMDVPDVPITTFTLRLVPGRYGVIRTVPSLCSAESRSGRAKLGFRGQNGRYVSAKQKLRISGCGAARRGPSRRTSTRRGSARAGKGSATKQGAGKR